MKQIARADLSWIIELATLVVVIVGLTFAAMELRQLRSEQESQTMLQLYQTVQSDNYIEATNLILALPEGLSADEIESRLTEEERRLILQLRLTIEALGIMVYRGDISIGYVDELFRLIVTTSWRRLEALTLADRERTGYLGLHEWHQWLAERLIERNQGQPVPAYEAYADWRE
jgi:hypothetical protein